MARINLLPWREELRKERQRQFITTLVVFALVSLGIWGYVHYHMTNLMDIQHERNEFLTKEIATLDQQIKEIKDLERKKSQLLARMEVIQQLQRSRPMIVHLFEDLVNVMPEGVYLNRLKHTGSSIATQGKAESNSRVSALMRNIEASDWLTAAVLGVVETPTKGGESTFTLQAQQRTKKRGDTSTAAEEDQQ